MTLFRILSALLLTALTVSPGLAQEARAPSPEAKAAWDKRDLERFDWLLLRETNACLAAAPPPACLELMLIVRERLGSYHYFGRELGPPSEWDPTRPTITASPANEARAAEIGAQAVAVVLARYGATPDIVMDGAGVVGDDPITPIVTLYRALPTLLGGESRPIRAALAARLYALGEIAAALDLVGLIAPDDPDTLVNNRAAMMLEWNPVFGDAPAALAKLHDTRQRSKDSAPVPAAITGLNLARLRHLEGDFERADALYQINLPILQAALPRDPRLAATVVSHAETLLALDRAREAELMLREARALLIAQGGQGQASVTRADTVLADALLALDRPEDAEALLRAAIARLADVDRSAREAASQIARRLAEPGYINMELRPRFVPDASRRLIDSKRIGARLKYRLATALETRGRLPEARQTIGEAWTDDPYFIASQLMRVRLELMRKWDDPIDDFKLESELFAALGNLSADHPDRIVAHVLQATLNVRRFGAPITARRLSQGWRDRSAPHRLPQWLRRRRCTRTQGLFTPVPRAGRDELGGRTPVGTDHHRLGSFHVR